MFTSLPGGVRRVADGEQRGELLYEGVALQLALVVLRALRTTTSNALAGRNSRNLMIKLLWEEIFVNRND